MAVGKNILEIIKEERPRLFGHLKRMIGNRLSANFRMGTRRKTKKAKT
jgi:hypothetical protein